MPQCSAYGCYTGSESQKGRGQNYTLHQFPKIDSVRKDWLERINRAGFVPSKNSRLCAKHFSPECYETGENNVDDRGRKRKRAQTLKSNAVPTLQLRPIPEQQVRFRGWKKNRENGGCQYSFRYADFDDNSNKSSSNLDTLHFSDIFLVLFTLVARAS